jgi:hypothetical protein
MKMRNLFSLLAAAAFDISIVAGGCAKEHAPSPSEQPAENESAAVGTKTAPKARVKLFTGTIAVLDAEAGALTLKGPRGERRFQVHEEVKEQLDGLKIGDKVIVKHTSEMAHSIVKPGAILKIQTRKEKESSEKWGDLSLKRSNGGVRVYS